MDGRTDRSLSDKDKYCTVTFIRVTVSCLSHGQLSAMSCSPSGSSVHGFLQARILEWVAYPFSRGSSHPMDGTQVSHITGRFFTS